MIFFALLTLALAASTQAVSSPACSFEASGHTFDLTQLREAIDVDGPLNFTDIAGEHFPNELLAYYLNPCGTLQRPNNCSMSSAIISCRYPEHNPSGGPCSLDTCNCCDSEGSFTDVNAVVTPDCHLKIEYRSGASNAAPMCPYVSKYPNQTTTLVFICDPAAGVRGYIEPAYWNDDRDYCAVMFYYRTQLACDWPMQGCVPHTLMSVIVTFAVGIVLTFIGACAAYVLHSRSKATYRALPLRPQ